MLISYDVPSLLPVWVRKSVKFFLSTIFVFFLDIYGYGLYQLIGRSTKILTVCSVGKNGIVVERDSIKWIELFEYSYFFLLILIGRPIKSIVLLQQMREAQ